MEALVCFIKIKEPIWSCTVNTFPGRYYMIDTMVRKMRTPGAYRNGDLCLQDMACTATEKENTTYNTAAASCTNHEKYLDVGLPSLSSPG